MRALILRSIATFFLLVLHSIAFSQVTSEWSGFYPEGLIRQLTVTSVLPESSKVKVNKSLLVQIKLAIDGEGRVAAMRLPPKTDPNLKTVLADAVSQWTFRLPVLPAAGKHSMSHLTFKFFFDGSAVHVELFDPEPTLNDTEHLSYWNTPKEVHEWNNWEEVHPTKSAQ
jgi:hypothetical protein